MKQFVQKLYRNVLLHDGDTARIEEWSRLATNGLSSIELTKGVISSAEARPVLAILRLYDVFFNRAADSGGLQHWVDALRSGQSLGDIALSFFRSEEFRLQYLGRSASDTIEAFYGNLFARSSDAGGKAFWLGMVEDRGWSPGQVAAAFALSEESLHPAGAATRFAQSYLAFRAANMGEPSTDAIAALAKRDLVEAIKELQTVSGVVQAGTLGHALVYRTLDEARLPGGEAAAVFTDADGRFMLSGGYGGLYAKGGKDMTIGADHTWLLCTVAPAHGGEIMITPLTTVIHALVNRGHDAAQAALLVNQAFGIDRGIDLLSFHHIDQALDTHTTADAKRKASSVVGAIAEISVLTEGVAALVKAAAKDPGVDVSLVSLRVADALAKRIADAASQGRAFQSGTLLNLSSAGVAAELMADSLASLSAAGTSPLHSAGTAQGSALVADAARIVAAFNAPLGKTVQVINGLSAIDTATMIDVLSVMARMEGLALRELQILIAKGAQDGDLSAEAAALLARDLGAAVRSFAIGPLAGGVPGTEGGAIMNLVFNTAPPQGGGASGGVSDPPPDFFMTLAAGKITFSGSAAGEITLAIDMSGTISFWRGGIMASAKGSALSSLVIELPAGQVLRLTSGQLAQMADLTIKGGGSLIVDGALSIAARNAIHFDNFTGAFNHRIQDTPDNILNAASASLNGAQQVTVNAGSNAIYSVADALKLIGRLTDTSGLTLGVADTAAALLANHSITGVTTYRLSENASDLSVANAAALTGIGGFSANGKTISVLDTAAALLANHSITGVTAYRLSENASDLSVANAAALAGIGGFSANGKSITVLDTAAAILGNHGINNVGAYRLSANATGLSVANAAALAGITGFDANGKSITVQDSAAAIIANHSVTGVAAYQVLDTHASILSNHAAMSYASGFLLSADAAGLTVADATALAAVSGFSVNNHAFTVKDSFAAIRAKHDITGVTRYQLDASTSVANIQTLNNEGLEIAKLRYVVADLGSSISAASTTLLNGADNLFSSASSSDDYIDLYRSGAITVQTNIDLGSGNDTFLGGKGEDYINGNLGVDVIDGGPGRDFYIYSDKGTDSQVSSGVAAAAGFDVVNIAGGDAFYIAAFSAVRTVLDAANPAGGSGADLLAALNDAYAPVRQANSDIMFVRFLDGNQYLVINDGQDGNGSINAVDTVIKIVGSGLPEAAGSTLLLFKEA